MKSYGILIAVIASLILIGCGGGGGTAPAFAIHNEWAWIGGTNIVNQMGAYGTQGTASLTNVPGARTYASTWTDAAGNFWLFGGYGESSSGPQGDLNDLWKYIKGQWTWISGSNTVEQAGNYGTRGIAASSNVPGARYMAASWTDNSGTFWLFGGLGLDSAGTRGQLNDLWKYSNGQWTWMSGSNTTASQNLVGVYGTQGVAAPGNVPGARFSASSWTDSSGNLWLFGGFGWDSTGTPGNLNDLWKYSAGEWTWMAGANVANQYGTYGTLGTAAPGNTPGSRFSAASWTDSDGNFWLFGGDGADANGIRCQQTGSPCNLSDLWKYSAGEWTWMGGPNQSNEPGVYGTQGTAAPDNIPGARNGAATWTDAAGNVWLFGGTGPDDFSDLWKYTAGQWTWMSGPNQPGQAGAYGTLGVAASGNVPGCRDGAVSWTDKSGNLWLFGGDEIFCIGNGKFNDLWEYQP